MIETFKSLSPGLQKWLKIFFVACAGLTLLDLFVHKHGDHWWNFFGFHSMYGFVACVLLVIIATWMRKPLMRSESYYDSGDEDAAGDDSGGDGKDD